MTRHRFLPGLLILGLAAATSAQTEREHAAHVHGQATAQLVIDAGMLALELMLPGMDAVGFEHAAASKSEQQALRDALKTLEDSGAWLRFDPADACRIERAEAHGHGYDGSAGDAHAEHDDPGHDHGHDQGPEGESGHAGLHVTVEGRCDAMPTSLRLSLAERFPALQSIQVDLIAGSRQDRVQLTRGNDVIDLGD